MALWDAELNIPGIPSSLFDGSFDGSDIYFVFGGSFAIDESMDLTLDYLSFSGSEDGSKAEWSNVAVGLQFDF